MSRELFGAIAQRKQYVSAEDVERALAIQKEINERGEPHKLLGIIMLEMGVLSSNQLLNILKEMENQSGSQTY